MSPKIKELAEQVYGSDVHYDDGVFAELIIKECFIALKSMQRDMISRGQACAILKRHFGLENG